MAGSVRDDRVLTWIIGGEEAAMRRTTPEEKSFTIRIAASSPLHIIKDAVILSPVKAGRRIPLMWQHHKKTTRSFRMIPLQRENEESHPD